MNYLETFEDCKQIEFKETVRVQPREIDAWERKNLPYKLPDDMKAFYQVFDGFKLTYGAEVSNTHVPVGTLQLNSLAEVERTPIEGTFLDKKNGSLDNLNN